MQPVLNVLQPYLLKAQPYIDQGSVYLESLPQNSFYGAMGGQIITLVAGDRLGFISALAIASYPKVDQKALLVTAGLYLLPPIAKKVTVQVVSTAIIETTKAVFQTALFPFKALSWLVSSDAELKRQKELNELLNGKILRLEQEITELKEKLKQPQAPSDGEEKTQD